MNAFCGRSVTRWPLLSTTVAWQTTRRVSARNTVPLSSRRVGLLAGSLTAHCHGQRRDKPTSEKVAKTVVYWKAHNSPFSRKPGEAAVRAVAPASPGRCRYFPSCSWFCGRVAEHVLVAQFHSDLGGDVRQLVQIFHRELPAAGLFRDLGQQARPGQLLPASGRASPTGS